MADTAYQRLLDLLDGVRANGNQAQALCPAHDDQDPSLSVTAIEDQVLVHCHVGCDIKDVVSALDLTMADLFDQPKTTYHYDDGRLVHRSYNHKGKRRFTQENTGGPPQLYRLGKVAEAVARGDHVVLVEGEKDVHALESLGVVATTAPMGAGNWSKVDPSPLHGAHLVVVPDRDQAGRRWASDVLASLKGKTASLVVLAPKVGKDVSDHVAAGHGLAELVPVDLVADGAMSAQPAGGPVRQVRLTPASQIKMRPVRWLWQDRIPIGEITLTPGRGGVGKSTFHTWMIAQITTGQLSGICFGAPRACIIATTEDSWSQTVAPRLAAAGANLDLAYRVTVERIDLGDEVTLSLPTDVDGLAAQIGHVGAVLLSVDPLLSVVSGALDTHKDRDVRQALEPLHRLADQVGIAVLGNAHFNKGTGSDPMNLIMASAAFGNVPRAVLAFAADSDDEQHPGSVVISQIKNNLGRLDLPSLRYRIDGATVDTDEGPAQVGRLVMLGESNRSVAEILKSRGNGDEERSEQQRAKAFLDERLRGVAEGDEPLTNDVMEEGREAHNLSVATLKRARQELGVVAFQRERKWYLKLPDPSAQGLRGSRPNGEPLTSENDHSTCRCETPKARRLADGRWFCSTCGRQIPTEEGSS